MEDHRGTGSHRASRREAGRHFSRVASLAAAMLLSFFGAFLCEGQVPGLGPAAAEVSETSDLRVSIKARDLEIKEVLRSFAQQIGAVLALDPAVQGRKISIQTDQAKLEHVMNDLCVAIKCEWTLSDGEPRALFVRASSHQARE
jgi:hypothetical protein